jgi:hypothetical protein
VLPAVLVAGAQGHVGRADGAVAEVGHRREVALLGIRGHLEAILDRGTVDLVPAHAVVLRDEVWVSRGRLENQFDRARLVLDLAQPGGRDKDEAQLSSLLRPRHMSTTHAILRAVSVVVANPPDPFKSVVADPPDPAPDDALNAICPYWTMFPLEFPLQALADGRPGEWVLDPFCGRGTTLFAARKLGMGSVGIDSNPVAAAIAQAKLVSPRPASVVHLARELMAGPAVAEPDGDYWRLAYSPRVLQSVCRLREGLLGREDAVAIALRGILLGSLHGRLNKRTASYLSNQMPRTYATKPAGAVRFWRARAMEPPEVDVLEVIARHAKRRYGCAPAPVPGAVFLGDASEMLSGMRRRFSWVITSPPYPGMATYRADGWLRGWLLGGPPQPDYDRAGQLGALRGERFIEGLAQVWRATAARCRPGARLIVRFGALPSAPGGDPEELLLASLRLAGGWEVSSVTDAGVPPGNGARQASQLRDAGEHVPEIDVIAIHRG